MTSQTLLRVSAPNNADFARSAVISMPGYELPPAGAFTMELRRRETDADTAYAFSTAIGNLRVTTVDAPNSKITLVLLARYADWSMLSGLYVADLVYSEGDVSANIGGFLFSISVGVTRHTPGAPLDYADLSAWGPIVDVSGQSSATVLAMLERGLRGPKGDQGDPGPAGVSDHGLLAGLGDDDHPQYLNNARGDLRYSALGHTHTIVNIAGLQAALDGKAAVGHSHVIGDVTGLQSALDGKASIASVAASFAALAAVANTGAYGDLSGRPTLGAAAALGIGAGLGSSGGSVVLGDGAGLSYAPSWNNGATAFTGLKLNVTDTASAAGSLLLDLQKGGVSQIKVDKSGIVRAAGGISLSGAVQLITYTNNIFTFDGIAGVNAGNGYMMGRALALGSSLGAEDTILTRRLTHSRPPQRRERAGIQYLSVIYRRGQLLAIFRQGCVERHNNSHGRGWVRVSAAIGYLFRRLGFVFGRQ